MTLQTFDRQQPVGGHERWLPVVLLGAQEGLDILIEPREVDQELFEEADQPTRGGQSVPPAHQHCR